ncbi:MAG: BamA/TamA family outer membrane protein [bacterium]|nr:BamA/TamA family outer membrane protein [bacterium]
MKKQKIIIFSIIMLLSVSLFSQYAFFYGKNKVLKHRFKWQHVETPNFFIYYYTKDMNLVNKVAHAAEQGYSKISQYLNIKVKKRIPLIFYSTHIDFELTNILGYVPQGVVAFAQSTTYRVVVQGDASFESLARTITHELGHIFEYEILGRRNSMFSSPPLWVVEGFSEFMAETWEDFNLLTVRDSVIYDQIPQIHKYGELRATALSGRTPYDFGHIIYEFIDYKFGKRGVKKFLYALRKGSLFRGRRDMLKVFDYTPKLFNYEFGKYVRKKFKKFVLKENPEDYSYIIGPDFPFAYSFSHELSPSGEMIAVLTVNYKARSLDIILISAKDGRVIKRITPGYTSQYDGINLRFNPKDGKSFTWNRESDTIAFFARKEWDNYLLVMNILDGKILKKINVSDIQQASSPDFLPGTNTIYFTGQVATKSYIYSLDLDTGKKSRLTDGHIFIEALDISEDGKKIVYSGVERGKKYIKLYLAPIENPNLAKRITHGDYNDITPAFSVDSKKIFYSSYELGSYNINKLELNKKMMYRYTDVRTGNFYPIQMPKDEDSVIMSSYYKGRFSLFRKDVSQPQDKRSFEMEAVDTKAYKEEKPAGKDFKIVEKGKYKPLKKLFVKSLPPIGVSIGTDGGIWGYSYMDMSDLMGDHNFSMMFASMYGYRSYQFMYLNQQNPLKLFARFFLFKQKYYTDYATRETATLREMYGAELGVQYPFSRSYRIESSLSMYHQEENYASGVMGTEIPFGQYFSGTVAPIRISLVGETTRFQNYGPNRGHTFKLTYQKYFKLGDNFMDGYSAEADIRKYIHIDDYTLLAFRFSGYTAGGTTPMIYWTGGNNTFRSEEFRRLTGTNMFLFNAEFRFPLVHAALTPIGIVGPVRATLFFDVGGIWYKGQKFVFFKDDKFQLQDAISSMGYGVEFFLFGYPMHLDWVWKIDWQKKVYNGVHFWIGYDF